MTSPESAVSSDWTVTQTSWPPSLRGTLIMQFPRQVVWLLPQDWCLIRETHWAVTWTGYLTSPKEWCLVRETHQAVTHISCPTFYGVSLGRLIGQLVGQVEWLSPRVVSHQGDSQSSFLDKLSWPSLQVVSHQGDSLGSFQDKVSDFPQESCLIRETHWAVTWKSWLASPVWSCSWEWFLIVETHQIVTQTLIKQLPRQVVQAPLCDCVARSQ